MAQTNGSDALKKHQNEVCNAFARAAAAMRDAAHTAESFSNWFSRVNNLQNITLPPVFTGTPFNVAPNVAVAQHEPEESGKKRKAPGDPEGKKKRVAKEKKIKDANAPKRPPSAYLLFQNQVRKEFKLEHPEMPYNQILSEISKVWHAMSPEEKAPFVQATADSKVEYEKAKADYETHSPTEAEGKSAVANNKAPAAEEPSASKSSPPAAATSDDQEQEEASSESSEESSSSSDEEEEAPAPPRKKSKKEVVKAPTPPPAKVEKKKSGEGKKRKKSET